MTLRLRAMSAEEFAPWRETFVREWGEDLARADDLPLDEAIARATRNTDADLPSGTKTTNHFLFVLLEEAQRVGTLWFSIDANGRAVLDDLAVAPQLRGKGYGRQALVLLEAEAASRGCRHISLNVYRRNAAAISLYETAGYETTQLGMRKRL